MIKLGLKFFLPLSIIIGCVMLPASLNRAQAGSQRWSAWAYQADTRTMMLFVENGTNPVNSYVLPLPSGMTRIQGSIAVSHQWNYFAYVASNESGNRALVIYNRDQQAAAHIIPLPAQTASSLYANQYDWQATEDSFNEDSTSIAFGYAMQGGRWAIYVYSLTAANGTASLTSDSPEVQPLHIPATEGWVPVVQRFSHTQIVFSMANSSTQLPTHYDTYAWDTSAHTVAATNAYPMVNADTLETTGETVAVGADSRFPANANPGATNVLLAYSSATGTSAPFYTTNAVSIVDAKFIQNGERIVYSGVNPPAPQRHFTVIQRDGTMIGDLSDPNISDVIGWQDGVIYLSGTAGAAQTLYVLNTRTGLSTPPEVAWTGTAGAAPLRLLQTPGNMNSTGPFTAWAQLAQPAQAVPTLVPATPQPASSGGGRIVFPAGATSVSVQGTVTAGGMDRWVLKALGGQTMTAQLTFSSGQAILIVFGVDGSVLQSDHATSPTFSGVLPLTEDYNIDVRGNPDTATSYTLSITIPPLQPPMQPTPMGKRIVFPAGATSVAVQGSLAPSGTDRWVIKALGGQTLTAKLTFSSGIAILIIFSADGNVLISDHAATQTFTGVLPSTQDYIIDVRNNPNSSTNYTLTVIIPPLH